MIEFVKAWVQSTARETKLTHLLLSTLLAVVVFETVILTLTPPDWSPFILWPVSLVLTDMAIFYFKEYRGSDGSFNQSPTDSEDI